MAGYVRYHAPARRWLVGFRWHGKEERFWQYKGEPLFHEKTALKLLGKIQADVDNGIFDPRSYRPDSPLSISKYSETWLKLSTACKNTKKNYRNAIAHAIAFYGQDKDIRELKHSNLVEFKNSLKLSDDAIYNIMSALKTMLRFYQKDVPTFPIPTFPAMSKKGKDETVYLTFDEQETVLKKIPERHRPIFTIMMEYGLRPQEATALRTDRVDEESIDFSRSHSEFELIEHTKTGRTGDRKEQITSRARAALQAAKAWPSFKGWVFCYNDKGSHYTNKVLNQIWKAACQEAGIAIGLYEAVRHSLGCQLADQGYSIDFIQDVYKHTDIKTTRRYARRQRSMIANALEARGQVIHLERIQSVK